MVSSNPKWSPTGWGASIFLCSLTRCRCLLWPATVISKRPSCFTQHFWDIFIFFSENMKKKDPLFIIYISCSVKLSMSSGRSLMTNHKRSIPKGKYNQSVRRVDEVPTSERWQSTRSMNFWVMMMKKEERLMINWSPQECDSLAFSPWLTRKKFYWISSSQKKKRKTF